jgi:Zn-dependent peptidase ImmA (M78 family)/O-acetyl-ADP-ribose deacetylase (regulator of RNase III)
MKTSWTNRSVRLLSKDGDPEEVIVQRARSLTLEMLESGWPGPPFDPLWVAERMGVDVVPVADAPDARTIPSEAGKFHVRIEYNPDRPQARRRFSLAHELAHLLFQDVAETTRNRAKVDRALTDDWQLELLCNLGASEIVMPVGSLQEELESEPSIHSVVALQQKLDVSFEALLLRLVRLTDSPVVAFAASRANPKDPLPFRLDYSVPSRTWSGDLPRRGSVTPDGLADCTAVGYTSGADSVRWPGVQRATPIECVGVPPFPGHRWPRVVGFLFGIAKLEAPPKLRIVYGDATSPMGDRPWIIAHVVNDKARAWHGGFAAALRRRYPESQSAFIERVSKERPHLGDVIITQLEEGVLIASMVAQAGFGASKTPRIRYQALRDCLSKVSKAAAERKASVHMPRIGTGQAGGRWSVIGGLVDEELVARDVPVTIYELPGARAQVTQEELTF